MPDDGRVRRALLFMPGDDLKKIARGAAMDVDCVVMDLEDGVALNNKQAARETVLHALTSTQIDFGRTERLVRLNAASSGLQDGDLTATVEGKPHGYVLPKVESAEEIKRVSEALATHELALHLPVGSLKLLPLIETAMGVVNLREIAQADERLVALLFGALDLAGDMGAVRTPEGHEGFHAKSAVVLHAAAFGLQAIDSPWVDIKDIDGLTKDTMRSMQMGYSGKLAIHPGHIEPIVGVFTPSEEEVEAAQKLIAAFEAHQAEGTGAFAYEGQMVDMPIVRAAQRVVARAEAANRG